MNNKDLNTISYFLFLAGEKDKLKYAQEISQNFEV